MTECGGGEPPPRPLPFLSGRIACGDAQGIKEGGGIRGEFAPPDLLHTRIGMSTYSASGFAASLTMVGAAPSANRNCTSSPIRLVMSVR